MDYQLDSRLIDFCAATNQTQCTRLRETQRRIPQIVFEHPICRECSNRWIPYIFLLLFLRNHAPRQGLHHDTFFHLVFRAFRFCFQRLGSGNCGEERRFKNQRRIDIGAKASKHWSCFDVGSDWRYRRGPEQSKHLVCRGRLRKRLEDHQRGHHV